MTSKPDESKKKKSVVLNVRDAKKEEEPVERAPGGKRKVVVKKKPVKKRIRRKSATQAKEGGAGSGNVSADPEPPVPNVAQVPEGTPVELNDPSIQSPEEQRPLDPSLTQRTPQPTPPREVLGEPSFKFFCYRCGQKLQVPVSWANKSYPCGRCHNDIVIPPPLVRELW